MFYKEGGGTLAQVAQSSGRCPIPGTFKVRLARALSNLIRLKLDLLTAGGLDQMAFKGPFPPKPLGDSLRTLWNLNQGLGLVLVGADLRMGRFLQKRQLPPTKYFCS